MKLACPIALALAASLAACIEPTTCRTTYESAQTNYGGAISSGRDLIAVTWYPELGARAPLAALVSPSGAVSKPVTLPAGFNLDPLPTATGHASAIWLAPLDDGFDGLGAAVVGDDGVTSWTVSPTLAGEIGGNSGVVFDGTSYRVFWLAGNALQYCEVSERGVRGTVHDLAALTRPDVAKIFAVADSHGSVYVVLIDDTTRILALDPGSGLAKEIGTGDADEYSAAFWLDGEIHLRHDVWTDEMHSFDPATATWRMRPMPAELDRLQLYPSATTLYVWDYVGTLYELDANLAVIAKHSVGAGRVATFGSDWVAETDADLDEQTLMPGRVQLARRAAASEDVRWKIDLVVDSPVVVGKSCSYDIPAENQNPGE